jgi:PAS domain S-box-containing protein
MRDTDHLASILEGIPDGFWAVDHRWRLTYFNCAAERFFGRRREDLLGRLIWDVFPTLVGSAFEPGYRRAMDERTTLEFEAPSAVHPGRWLEVRAFPTPEGLGVAFRDITERRRAEAAAAEGEAHFAAVFGQAAAGMCEAGLDGSLIRANDRYLQIVGYSREELLGGMTIRDLTHPDDWGENLHVLQNAIATGGSFVIEKRYVRKDRETVWVSNSVTPLIREGQIRSVLAVTIDVTERRRSEAALRESEARFRNVADQAPVMIWMTNTAGLCTYLNRQWYEFTGQTEAEGLGYGWLDAVHPEDRPSSRDVFILSSAGRQPFRLDYRIRRHDGEYRWAIDTGTPRLGADGQFLGFIGSVLDISDRKRLEEHQSLLINELNHRVKNTLATVQAIALQTLRSGEVEAHVSQAFTARLIALAKAHDVLTRENWEGADLKAIIDDLIHAHHGDDGRFGTSGPHVRLSPRVSLSLTMALHELSTNAMKHGALSNDSGRIALTWQTLGSGSATRLRLRWEERGGPPVAPPTRKGFGSRLLERGLSGELAGEVQITYDSRGLTCEIDIPLAEEPGIPAPISGQSDQPSIR